MEEMAREEESMQTLKRAWGRVRKSTPEKLHAHESLRKHERVQGNATTEKQFEKKDLSAPSPLGLFVILANI